MKCGNYILFIFFMCMAASASLRAESVKTNESRVIGNLRSLVSDYTKVNKKLPESWAEMMKAGFIDGKVLERARNYTDFESRYRFLDDHNPVVVSNRVEKIIVMEISSGGSEGGDSGGSDATAVGGRWLIVELPTGEIETRNYPEMVLDKLFKKAGFDLADYTGDGGKWLPVGNVGGSNAEANGSKLRKGSDFEHIQEKRSVEKPSHGIKHANHSIILSWLHRNRILLLGGCILLILPFAVKVLKRKS